MRFLAILLCLVSLSFAAKADSKSNAKSFTADSLLISVGTFTSPSAVWHKGAPKHPQVYVWFHGGMQSSKCAKGYEAGGMLVPFLEKSKKENIVVSVSACKENHWLTPVVLKTVDAMLDSVQARYQIQIDTVSLVGVSDGGLGIAGYTLYGKRAVRARLLVSTNLSAVSDAQNLSKALRVRQGSWTFLQGGSDRLYPSNRAVPWMDEFCSILGAKQCTIHFDNRGEHDWSWWTSNREGWIREFVP
jgi:hypothetical protein